MSRALRCNNFHFTDPLQDRAALVDIAEQLARLNDNIESGRISVRTHHPLCTVPQLNNAIQTGAFVVPPREGEE